MKKLILKEIQNQRNVYKSDNSRIISDYNNEIETMKEYSGRQILELLQNADDEKSDEVLIEVNTTKNTLIIANKGKNCSPFKIGGIKSLMVSNYSPKLTKKYIGNKGLGFRSIISWSNKIVMNSQNLDVTFSKTIASNYYNEICDAQKHKQILENRNLPLDTIPIAFLSFPEVKDNPQTKWTTIIKISYKNDRADDILKQVNAIRDEVLLFVNHINVLRIKINDYEKKIERIKDSSKIYLNDVLWSIFEKNELLPKTMWDKSNEPENFQLKIAIQDNFKLEKNLLYSYFPTKIDIDFPFIIHGTFDLNGSRNGLNDFNDKNRYILGKLVELIINTAKDITKNEVSFKALELLSYNKKNNVLDDLGLYKKIDDSIDDLEVFPCLDNKYRKRVDVVFISDDFSNFVVRTGNHKLFPNMLIAADKTTTEISKYLINNEIDDYNNKINVLSQNLIDINDRVEFIHLVHEIYNSEKFELLIDEKQSIITKNDDAYTPITKDYEINLPDFVKIKFIHKELYFKLLDKFNITSNERSRDLQRILKYITNIQSYEPAQVVQKIISSTNKELEKQNVQKQDILKKMVLSLFENYKNLGEKTSIAEHSKIQLISKTGSIVNAKNLFLSKSLPAGELTEVLFDEIFDENQFLGDREIYDFEVNEDIKQIESFFLWLGVNKYTKFEQETNDFHYQNFIFSKIQKPPNFKDLSFNLLKIFHFEKIIEYFQTNNQYEKLILWILSDKEIYDEIKGKKTLHYFYVTSRYLYDAPSYILYQLYKSNLFKDYIISNDNLSVLINKIEVNFDSELFKKYQINRADIESLILRIGGVSKFEDLSIEAVKNILLKLPEKNPDGKQSLTIYKECIEHYKKNKQPLENIEIPLCAKKVDIKAYYSQNEVYYNGSIKLPKRITEQKAILNFPRRQSTKNVIKFFCINDLNSISIKIKKYKINEHLSEEFNQFIKKIIIFIIVHRFEDSTTEASRKKDINRVKKINIQLCDQVEYEMDNNVSELDNNDYIMNSHTYYVKVRKNSNFEKLRKELDFRETFADIIGSIFDISDTNKFSRLISDNLRETEEMIKRDIGYDAISIAASYLGTPNECYDFWKSIYAQKSMDLNFALDNDFLLNINNELNIEASITEINYTNLSDKKNVKLIKLLFAELNISLTDFNSTSYAKISFYDNYLKDLRNFFFNQEKAFKSTLWHSLNNEEKGKQKDFLNLINKFEDFDQYISDKSKEFQYKFNINELEIFNGFIKQYFNFYSLQSTIIDIFENYKKNSLKFSSIELEIIENDIELKSLLYFEKNLDLLKNIFEQLNTPDVIVEEEDDDDDITIITEFTVIPVIIPSAKGKKPYIPPKPGTSTTIGNLSEKKVYTELVKRYSSKYVSWKSKDDEGLHYDVRYSQNKGKNWIYVEVKTFNNNRFFISKDEKLFGEKHKGNYEIWLVKGNVLYPYKMFLNSDYEIAPKDFIVSLEIKQNNE